MPFISCFIKFAVLFTLIPGQHQAVAEGAGGLRRLAGLPCGSIFCPEYSTCQQDTVSTWTGQTTTSYCVCMPGTTPTQSGPMQCLLPCQTNPCPNDSTCQDNYYRGGSYGHSCSCNGGFTAVSTDANGASVFCRDNAMSDRDSLIRYIQYRSPATTFNDPTSPQSQALDWILNTDTFAMTLMQNGGNFYQRLAQRFALTVIYFGMGGSTWWPNDIFAPNATLSECDWSNHNGIVGCLGVTGFVDSLSLFEVGMIGSIPEEIGLLTSLEGLNIAYNRGITGTIPTEIGLLTNLKWGLSLYENTNLSGSLPTELANLSNLQYLMLQGLPHVTGLVPTSLCSNLKLAQIDCDPAHPQQILCDCCVTETQGTTGACPRL